MQLKPMENVFIGMVRKLNEELHKVSKVDAETVTEIKTKLDQHLAKAHYAFHLHTITFDAFVL
ncbi:MAG: hypothetical protein AAFV93_23540, partial [Chloroflexota bacterium]